MEVELNGLTKEFGEETAVDDVSLTAEEGELTTLVGPSGCGKTTTMRCIAGLERPTTGTVQIGGEVVSDLDNGVFVPTQKRDVGMVFQTFDVWAHMTVFENVAFPLRIRDYSESEIEDKVMNILELADIADLRNNNASDLSGGQQARVGITRALVYEPKVLLCDEPLTGLDRNLRERMRYEIRELQQEVGITTIYVTHSQPEAMAISDKICLLRDGTLEQEGSGFQIYNEPISKYSFDFFGSSQFFTGDVTGDDTIQSELGQIKLNGKNGFEKNTKITVGFRPKEVSLSASSSDLNGENVWEGTITKESFLGDVVEYITDVSGTLIRSRISRQYHDVGEGDRVFVQVDPEDMYIFEGEQDVA